MRKQARFLTTTLLQVGPLPFLVFEIAVETNPEKLGQQYFPPSKVDAPVPVCLFGTGHFVLDFACRVSA
jgi:hypothetical protein